MLSRPYRYCVFLTLACAFLSSRAFAGLDSAPLMLQNEFLDAHFGANGLQSFNDHALQKSFAVADNTFSLTIDNHEILSRKLNPPEIRKDPDAIEYTFHSIPYRIQVIYELKSKWHFVSKRILVSTESGNRRFRVDHIQVLGGEISEHTAGVFVPHSFWTRVSKKVNDYALFVRLKDRTGIYMLVQNPFLSVESEGEKFAISYSPEMDWDVANGPFESDRACIGAYRLSGQMVSTEIIPEWKWEPQGAGNNESGEDQAEIEAFMDCVRAFILPHQKPNDTHRFVSAQ